MKLNDLIRLRTAPVLGSADQTAIIEELQLEMNPYQWFTVGIMAPSAEQAVSSLRNLEQFFGWSTHRLIAEPDLNGPVYLKANQQTLTARLRVEHGLGEGILISGQGIDNTQPSATWGPLPLDFVKQAC